MQLGNAVVSKMALHIACLRAVTSKPCCSHHERERVWAQLAGIFALHSFWVGHVRELQASKARAAHEKIVLLLRQGTCRPAQKPHQVKSASQRFVCGQAMSRSTI